MPDWRFPPARICGFTAQEYSIRRIRVGKYSFCLGLENQESINLIFPWRLMELDSLAYRTGIEKIQERNKVLKVTYKADDDFKYTYRKEDRLEPLLNLTLYWGKRKWKQPLALSDMVDMSLLPGSLHGLFSDYRVHLIHMRHIPETALQNMDSDLKYVLGLMKRTGSRKWYESYILENKEYFSRIPRSAVDVIDVCTGIKRLKERLQFIVNDEGEEEADMCKALREIVKDAERQGKRRGKRQGLEEGVKQGIKQGIKQGENLLGTLIDRLLSENRLEDARLAAVDEAARNRLYREIKNQ